MIMVPKTSTWIYGGIFLSSLLGICRAAPSASRNPEIWNHDDEVSRGSSLELQDYRDSQGITAKPENSKGSELMSSDLPSSQIFLVHGAKVNFEPAYENAINPFLSHIEQGLNLRPVRHDYMRRKPSQQQEISTTDDYKDELTETLPVNPDKPHFTDSTEGEETEVEENRAFGNEEKDLGDLFHVLFSADY